MNRDERERMQDRFGDRTFWQNHDDRTRARARAGVPSGNPFDPRRTGPTTSQPAPGYGQGVQQAGQLSAVAQWLQNAQNGPGGVAPRHDQHQADWDDDEGYSSDGGLDPPPPPQNVHTVVPQSNNRNNSFQQGAGQNNAPRGNGQNNTPRGNGHGPAAHGNNPHIHTYGYASHGAYMPPAPGSEYSQYSSHFSRR